MQGNSIRSGVPPGSVFLPLFATSPPSILLPYKPAHPTLPLAPYPHIHIQAVESDLLWRCHDLAGVQAELADGTHIPVPPGTPPQWAVHVDPLLSHIRTVRSATQSLLPLTWIADVASKNPHATFGCGPPAADGAIRSIVL